MRKKSLFSFLCVCIAVVGVFSCSTSHVATNRAEWHRGDSVASIVTNEGRVGHLSVDIDSVVSVLMLRDSIRQTITEQSTERITETITCYIDSLGREVRQEQRVIDRSESRQQESYYEQQLQQQRMEYAFLSSRFDSLLQQVNSQYQTHWEDSLAEQYVKDREAESAGSTVRQWIFNLFVCVFIAGLLVVFIVLLKKRINSLLH